MTARGLFRQRRATGGKHCGEHHAADMLFVLEQMRWIVDELVNLAQRLDMVELRLDAARKSAREPGARHATPSLLNRLEAQPLGNPWFRDARLRRAPQL
jgi:hypothetical protein